MFISLINNPNDYEYWLKNLKPLGLEALSVLNDQSENVGSKQNTSHYYPSSDSKTHRFLDINETISKKLRYIHNEII